MSTDLFLSYARAENEPLAGDLYGRLTAAGLAVWWDRECMPNRSWTFLEEIRVAIRDATRTAVIVDEPAIQSAYVQAEWQYALAAGKPVIPLLRLKSHDGLPPELAGLHSPDFRAQRPLDAAVSELLRLLADPVPPLGRLLGEVPDIPPHFQPRTSAFARLAGAVMLGRNKPVTLTGAQRIVVLHGMGGSGKSVLAAALARSTATQQAFSDGIVWLTPDADARPEALLRGIGALLGADSRKWQSRSDGVDGLRELLSGRRIGLMIDNVTSVALIEPLISALDLDTRVVVTTRLAGLVADLGARALPLDDLEPAEALGLLAGWAGCSPDALPPAAAQVAAECGYLPFALAINGAMVRRGTPWEDLLDAFDKHELEFARAHERFAHYPYRDVFRAIRPSIVELERSEPEAAERLFELAAFHWPQGVPESVVTRFWIARGCPSARVARRVLTDLADRSLLRLDGGAPTPRLRLHDIQLDYLIAAGADTRVLSRALLDSYGAQRSADWPSIDPDGYFHQHVVRHLIELEDFAELQRLIDQTNEGGGNAWFQGAEVADNVDGYLDDLDRVSAAWPEEASDIVRGSLAASLHHALIRASISSMSSSLSTEIRKALRRTSLWSSVRALAETRQVADTDERIDALLGVAPHLDDADRRAAIDEALALTRVRANQPAARHLTTAAGIVEPDKRAILLEEARSIARTIELPGYRAAALARIAELWDVDTRDEVTAEALDAATEEVDTAGVNQGGFDALGILAPLLPASSLPRLFDLVRRVPGDFTKAMAFAQVVPHVADPVARIDLAREGAEAERLVESNSVWIQIALALQLPDCDVDSLFEEVVRTDDRQVAYFLQRLPEMSAEDAERWVSRLRAIPFGSELSRFEALFEISRRLDGDARRLVLGDLAALAHALPYDTWRSRAYDSLAPELNARQLQTALQNLRTIGDAHAIGSALASVLGEVNPPVRAAATEFVRSRVDSSESLDVVVAAAGAADGEMRKLLLRDALEAWRQGASFGGGVYSPSLAIDTLVQLARMAKQTDRAGILQHLFDTITFGAFGAEVRAQSLVAAAEFLQPEFADECAAQLAQEALHETLHATTQSIDGVRVGRPEVLASTLHLVAPLLTAERATTLLDFAEDVPDEGWQMAARVAVAARLPEPTRSNVLRDAVATASRIEPRVEDPATNIWEPLIWLAKLLPGPDRAAIEARAVAAARAVGDSWRAAALAHVAEALDEPLRTDVVDEALEIGSDYSVQWLLPYLPSERAWRVARNAAVSTIAWSSHPTAELAATLAAGSAPERLEVWQELTGELRNLTRADLCSRYVALLPLLRRIGGRQAVNDLARSLLSTASWWR
jgi:hypothetical protein